jgi:nitrite reductase/ring-hydroxylating ferredoxin subunit
VIPFFNPSASNKAEEFVDVLALSELPAGEQRRVLLGFVRVLLCRTDHAVYAVAELCPHALQPLLGGEVRDGAIHCPRHAACFDLATGKPLNGVTNAPLRTYPLRIREGRIEIAATAVKS